MTLPDLTDLDLFRDGFPHEVFELHRRESPVHWHEPTSHTPGGEGFWSVSTYPEVVTVLREPVTYSSERGGDREHGGTLLQDMDVAGLVLNMMDDPRHARIRRLVSVGLTPRTISRLTEELRERTRRLLDAIDERLGSDRAGVVDIVPALAAELPMQAICILLGVPEADRHQLWEALDAGFDVREGDAGERGAGFGDGADPTAAQLWLYEYGAELIASKRAAPTDDMLSLVVHARLADVEPAELGDLELSTFFSLLFAAGSDTTRHAISGGLLALAEHPDQLVALRSDPAAMLPGAVEEILRWTTPSPSKRRTATCATTLRDAEIGPGDKVLVWEGSANRDPSVFADPMAFRVDRDPNPHLAFGHGAHYCLGANLARLELRVVLGDVLTRYAQIEVASVPEWTRSNRHTGIRRLDLRLG